MNTISEIEKVKEQASSVNGFLTDLEGELLYRLATTCPKEYAIVEIGSWQGRSTVWLGKGSNRGHGATVYAVDPHTGSLEHQKEGKKVWTFDAFKENIRRCGVEDVVHPLVMTSQEAARQFDRPIGLLFIDGLHDYESVKADLESWFPHLAEGARVAFHDSVGGAWMGPTEVVDEFILASPYFKNVGFIHGITYGTKVHHTNYLDRLKNRLTLLVKVTHQESVRIPESMLRIERAILYRWQMWVWMRNTGKFSL